MASTSIRATGNYPRHADVLIAFRKGRWEVGVRVHATILVIRVARKRDATGGELSGVHHVDVSVSNGASLESVAKARNHTTTEGNTKRAAPSMEMSSDKARGA
jgi:hypothetical protein